MKSNKFYIVVVFFALSLCSIVAQTSKSKYLLVISYDGFRWDYPEKVETPTFDSVQANGARVMQCQPCFPSKTFPNHYSMATGLYPDNHGIVLNSFYSKELKAEYRISNRKAVTDGRFYGGEPIWVAAEKQGVKSATLFWVGCEAEIKGVRPSYYYKYSSRLKYNNRLDTLKKWINLPYTERPKLIMMYFEQPDKYGHQYGPNSNEVKKQISYIDSFTKKVFQTVSNSSIADSIDIIITSDHGMSELNIKRIVNIADYVKLKDVKSWYGNNPAFMFTAKKNREEKLYQQLLTIPHSTTWKKDSIPNRLNFGKNSCIGQFVVVADSSWSIYIKNVGYIGGTHGYDNSNKDMQAIFYAIGPSFKKGITVNKMRNIDMYPLLAKILNLKIDKIDGDISPLIPLIKE